IIAAKNGIRMNVRLTASFVIKRFAFGRAIFSAVRRRRRIAFARTTTMVMMIYAVMKIAIFVFFAFAFAAAFLNPQTLCFFGNDYRPFVARCVADERRFYRNAAVMVVTFFTSFATIAVIMRHRFDIVVKSQ